MQLNAITPGGRGLLAVVVMVLVAHAPGWLLSKVVFLVGPVFDADILLALIACYFSLPLGMALLVSAWVVQLLIGMSLIFHFTSVAQFVSAMRFAGELQLGNLLSISNLALMLCYVLAAAVVVVSMRRLKPRLLPLMAPLVLLTVLDVANGGGLRIGDGATGLINANVSGSPAYNFISAVQKRRERQREPLTVVPGVIPELTLNWAEKTSGSVLLVVVESFGDILDPRIAEWLKQQLLNDDVEERWDFRRSSVPFRGSTTAGELRFLCGLGGDYSALDAGTAARCLPKRLLDLGYRTYGLHGFSGEMFLRHSWWPLIGLESVSFIDDLPAGLGRCGGAFRGACDGDVLKIAAGRLEQSKSLVYLLTLNTHLPISRSGVAPELVSLCAAARVSTMVCALTSLHGKFLRELRSVLLNGNVNPLVVIVGDHSPPFWRRGDRDVFSHETVPLFVLTPK